MANTKAFISDDMNFFKFLYPNLHKASCPFGTGAFSMSCYVMTDSGTSALARVSLYRVSAVIPANIKTIGLFWHWLMGEHGLKNG